MSIISEINRINTNIANAYTKAEEKGATLPVAQNSANLADTIDSITSGGGSEANIFVQLTEPETKKGIWLQKEATPEHYTYQENVYTAGQWMPDGILANIPFNFTSGSTTKVGAFAYLFGSTSSSDVYNKAYKYDYINNTFTQLTNIPYGFNFGRCTAVGTDIYLFGGNSTAKVSKYDTLTDTYTSLSDAPYALKNVGVVSIGTDIYLLGGSSSGYNTYKYNTLNGTYTQLTKVPYNYYNGGISVVGTDIYIFGGDFSDSTRVYTYRYNTLNDTWTKRTNIPYQFSFGSAVAVGNDIYLIGSNSNLRNFYKYNTLTNTYTQLTNTPSNTSTNSAIYLGTTIYSFGGNNTPKKVIGYKLESDTFTEDNMVVVNQGKYNTGTNYEIELYSNSKDVTAPKYPFIDAWYYTLQGGLDGTIPTYYGNGIEWVKFKN